MNRDFQKFKDMSCKSFIDYLLSLSSNELSLLAVFLGYLLSINIDASKQNSLGNFFELIGQLLLTISAQTFNFQPSTTELQQEINTLKIEIERLRRSIH